MRSEGCFFSKSTGALIAPAAMEVTEFGRLAGLLPKHPKTGVAMGFVKWFTGLGDGTRKLVCEGMRHEPGRAWVFRDAAGLSWANSWRPGDLGRGLADELLASGGCVDDAQVRPWLDLVWHICGHAGDAVVESLLDMFAMIVGDPREKPGWHLVLTGAQGLGKDTMLVPVRAGVGAHNVATLNVAGMHNGFSGFLKSRLVLVAELRQTARGSATARDNYATLKEFTENASPTIWVNEKYRNPVEVPNVACVVVLSNEVAPLAMDDDDRRWLVIASPAAPWDAARYAALAGWLGAGSGSGSELVCAWLRLRWHRMDAGRRTALLGRAPVTLDKGAMIEAGDPVAAWTRSQIEDGVWKWNLMGSAELDAAYAEAKRMGHLSYKPTEHKWGRVLTRLGAQKVCGGNPVTLPGGTRMRVWALRKGAKYEGLVGRAIRAIYAKERGLQDKTNAGVSEPGSNVVTLD